MCLTNSIFLVSSDLTMLVKFRSPRSSSANVARKQITEKYDIMTAILWVGMVVYRWSTGIIEGWMIVTHWHSGCNPFWKYAFHSHCRRHWWLDPITFYFQYIQIQHPVRSSYVMHPYPERRNRSTKAQKRLNWAGITHFTFSSLETSSMKSSKYCVLPLNLSMSTIASLIRDP